MTTTNSWLPLAEYSIKHQVSISTLRRRIKTEDIQFRFSDGKYLILDDAPKNRAEPETHRPSLSRESNQVPAQVLQNIKSAITTMASQAEPFIEPSHGLKMTAQSQIAPLQPTVTNSPTNTEKFNVNETGESVLTAANKLLIDLKKAYTQVLHEKEEQIMVLKEENVDLKTLIKILEFENSRLRE